jgi:ankyrin repeat protein
MLAIREGAQQLALAMLLNPAWGTAGRLEQVNKLGETAMMLAALKGNLPITRRLIEMGAQTNRAGWGPIHYAATSGHVEMINLLIEHFAYIDAQSPNGTTALMMAVRFKHRLAAERLIALGADSTLQNEAGLTARGYAVSLNDTDTAFWLEMEEIAFTNKYLRNAPKIDVEAIFRDPQAPAKPVETAPGVEVIPGIQ